MQIGLLDIDCHASKKKWGATVYPNLALCKGFRCIEYVRQYT